MMKNLQKIGGTAALIGASTNLLAIVMFITLASKGYGSDDPGQAVAFFADNQALMRVLYRIQYLVFGVSLIFLSLALYERLKAGSPVLVQAVTTFGLIWAFLVIVIGTLSINKRFAFDNISSPFQPSKKGAITVSFNTIQSD